MATKKSSPHRRRSIAVTNQNHPSIVPKGRRRAHSIVPGASLSPLAKARRSLAPRKSILKASINTLNADSSSQQSSAPSQSQNTTNDDINATRSMEITQDYTALVHDNTSRKSLGRRVSFAARSHVLLFESNHTNSTGSPQSSPNSVSSSPATAHVQATSNENDYPGQNSRRRRSSVRHSIAQSEDMDMTTINPGAFQHRGSAILDEEFDYDDEEYDDDNMDVTEAIRGDFARKRSLSVGGRQPLSQLQSPSAQESVEGDETRSDIGNESTQSALSDATSEQSRVMEFTIPLGQSLRPAEKDEVWLALKQMTHSGGGTSEPERSFDSEGSQDEDMNLDDAMTRLRRARDSLPLSQSEAAHNNGPQDDTFTSTEDSFDNDENDGNKTLNLSRVLGRQSLGLNSRMSMGYGSNMDESEVYGDIGPTQSTPRQSLAPQPQPSQPQQPPKATQQPQQPRKSLVFQPPPSDASVAQPRKSTDTFSFTSKAPSPSKATASSSETPLKLKPKPTFSAAFAPPVTRPSPKKPVPPSPGPHSLPAKRPRPSTKDDENMDVDKPSPAKRQALAGKWTGVADAQSEKDPSVSPTRAKPPAPIPRPLSPSKKAPFQAPTTVASESTSRPPSALRRPSGYFAKRKSLAVSFNIPSASIEPAPAVAVSSAKKKPGIGLGRASMGSAPAGAWTRFDKTAISGISDKASTSKANNAKEREADEPERETPRRASPSPSPTRGSPVPNRHNSVERMLPDPGPQSPERLNPVEGEDAAMETPEVGELSTNMEIDTDATRQWREGVEPAEYEEEVEVPSISVAQFFSMTGIKFMDELTAPRRSIHPSQQPIRQPRNPADIPLAEYVAAMAIDVPQLELYSRVSKDLEAWMAKSKIVFAQAEEEAAKVTPELFVEYAKADEEGQAELLHQLNLIRTHTRYLARSDWYDWKLQWVEGLRVTADEAFASLENDARALEEPKKSAAEIIPNLEKEYETLLRELEHEQAEVAEIEGGDQDYLNELKATIAEQNIEIEALKAELTEGTDQVRWLQERMDEIETQKREAKNTISTAERILRMKQTSTRSEVFRLKDELEALEDLHLCRITKVSADLFEYVYSSLFHVSIPCKNFLPIVAKVNISRYGKPNTRYKDDFPRLSSFLLTAAKQLITEGDELTVREIVHRLGDYWSSCAQLRSQLTLLNIKYPVEIVVPPISKDAPLPSFKAKAMVMFPSVMGKAYISFVFSFDTFSRWPISLGSLDCEVDIAYGPMDRSAVMKAVMSRLSQTTPSESYACLLDACIEAQDIY